MDAETVLTSRRKTPLKGASAARAAAKKRQKHPGNLVLVYGQKPARDWVVISDLEFGNFLDLESDPIVLIYDLDPDRVVQFLDNEGYAASRPDAIVRYVSGRRELREVKHRDDVNRNARALLQAQVQQAEAARLGYAWRYFTDADALAHCTRLLNWIQISCVLREARAFNSTALEREIVRVVKGADSLSMARLQEETTIDWRLVFVAVFRLYQRGRVRVDLDSEFISWSTVVSMGSEK